MKPRLAADEDSRAISLLRELRSLLAGMSREELPGVLAEVERTKATAWLRLAVPPSPEPSDALLTAPQAAGLLGFWRKDGSPDPSPLYRRRWPFRVAVSKGRTRFSRKGIDTFIRSRTG